MKIFYDGLNIQKFRTCYLVDGFTTNPTFFKSWNNNNDIPNIKYKNLAFEMLKYTDNKCVSFEVFADTPAEMIAEAREIASWDESIYVKIPVINTSGVFCGDVISALQKENIKLNITAVFTIEQLNAINNIIDKNIPTIISIFAGRIADTGIDPKTTIKYAVKLFEDSNTEILWASVREPYNITEAKDCGCHIITVPDATLNKYLECDRKDLTNFSVETVKMFYADAQKSGITIL